MSQSETISPDRPAIGGETAMRQLQAGASLEAAVLLAQIFYCLALPKPSAKDGADLRGALQGMQTMLHAGYGPRPFAEAFFAVSATWHEHADQLESGGSAHATLQ